MLFKVPQSSTNQSSKSSRGGKDTNKKFLSQAWGKKMILKTGHLTVLGLTLFSLMTLYAHAGLSFPSQFTKHTFPHLAAAKPQPDLLNKSTLALVPNTLVEVTPNVHSAIEKLEQAETVSTSSVIIQKTDLSRRQFFSNKPSRGFSPLSNVMTVFTLPIKGSYISSRFGYRNGRLHAGVDFSSHIGVSIYASASGRVAESGWDGGGYGNMVLIDHGNGMKTRYGHCSEVLVQPGAFVTRGQLIAKVGNTGHSTGPHLHYEVIANGIPRNPEVYFNR